MSELPIEEQGKIRKGGCFYRVLTPLCIHATGQWIPAGVVADLSDCEDASLTWLLQRGGIETTDPSQEQPVFNVAVGAVKRRPCPCGAK